MPFEPEADRTFDLRTPWALLLKMQHDIGRLDTATSSSDMRYAAIDCAIDAWHLSDWCLQHMDDDRHLELTGVVRHGHGASDGFLERNEARPTRLTICKNIANSGKHRILRKPLPDKEGATHTFVKFNRPFRAGADNSDIKMSPASHISFGGVDVDSVQFFTDMANEWFAFIRDERLIFQEDVEDIEHRYD